MSNLIVNKAPNAVTDALKESIVAQIAAFNPFKVGLNDNEKTGARTMSYGREGYARMISQIASSHVNSLAREHNPDDLVAKLDYDATLEAIRQLAMAILEDIEETQLANSMDLMKLVDLYSENLQSSRKNNSSLDAAMREVDDWNKRFGTKSTPKAEDNNI